MTMTYSCVRCAAVRMNRQTLPPRWRITKYNLVVCSEQCEIDANRDIERMLKHNPESYVKAFYADFKVLKES